MADRTAAQLYALAVGLSLVLAGAAGFLYSAAFGTPGEVDEVVGVLAVNGWHNVVHLGSGALGLLCAPSRPAARAFAAVFGATYLGVAAWGFAVGSGEDILGFLPVNTADNVLHVALGVLGLLAAALAHERAPTRRVFAP